VLTIRLELSQLKDAYETEREIMTELRRRLLDMQEQQATNSRAEQIKLSKLDQIRGSESFELNSDSRNSQYIEELKQATERLTKENQRIQKEL